jgi:hypothetical protein
VGPIDGRPEEVVLLGAGFSRALAEVMPLTDELGQEALGRAGLTADDPRLPAGGFHGGKFETWLSRLADDQPHLSDADNLDRRALFTRVSHGIHDALSERQLTALSSTAPEWFYTLLSVLHVRRPTVITLNYDDLVECGVDSHFLVNWDGRDQALVRGFDVINDMPPLPASPARWGRSVLPTFRLLKLHGSLSWYWGEGDDTGGTLQRWSTPGEFGAPRPEDTDARRRSLPGRVPFVIPPSATKSPFYRNLVTRELWQQAYDALRSTRRLVLVGYSLPGADLTIGGMIEDAASGRSLTVTVVNPCPQPVRNQLLTLGIKGEKIECRDGADCVEQFAHEYADLQARSILRTLKSAAISDNSGLLLAGWGPNIDLHPERLQPVIHIEPPDDNGDVIVHTPAAPTTVQPDPTMIPLLLERASDAARLVAESRDGQRMPIVDIRTRPSAKPGELARVTLVPAGRPAALR